MDDAVAYINKQKTVIVKYLKQTFNLATDLTDIIGLCLFTNIIVVIIF